MGVTFSKKKVNGKGKAPKPSVTMPKKKVTTKPQDKSVSENQDKQEQLIDMGGAWKSVAEVQSLEKQMLVVTEERDKLLGMIRKRNSKSFLQKPGDRFKSTGPSHVGKTIEIETLRLNLSRSLEVYQLTWGYVVKNDGMPGQQKYTSRQSIVTG